MPSPITRTLPVTYLCASLHPITQEVTTLSYHFGIAVIYEQVLNAEAVKYIHTEIFNINGVTHTGLQLIFLHLIFLGGYSPHDSPAEPSF